MTLRQSHGMNPREGLRVRAKGCKWIQGGLEFRIRDKNEIMWRVTIISTVFPRSLTQE